MYLQLLLLSIVLFIIHSGDGFLAIKGVYRYTTGLNAIRDLYPHYRRNRLQPFPDRLPDRVRLKRDIKKIGKKGDVVSVTVHQWRHVIQKKRYGIRLTPEEMEEIYAKKNATKAWQEGLAIDAHKNISALPRLVMYGTVDVNNSFVFPFLNRHLIDEIHDKIGIHNIARMILPAGVYSVAIIQQNSDGTEEIIPQEFNSRAGLAITKPGLYQFGIRLQRDLEPANVTVNLVPVPESEKHTIVR